MPPIDDPGIRGILLISFLDLCILANLEYEPLRKLITATSAERFLDYLYYLVQNDNISKIEQIFRTKRITSNSNIEVLPGIIYL